MFKRQLLLLFSFSLKKKKKRGKTLELALLSPRNKTKKYCMAFVSMCMCYNEVCTVEFVNESSWELISAVDFSQLQLHTEKREKKKKKFQWTLG